MFKDISLTGNKRLAVNMVSNITSYSVTIFISFFLTPYLINTLGKESYSFYPLANNFVSYMSIIANSLNSVATRFITIEIVKNNWDKVSKYFSSVLFANIILSVIISIPMTLIILFLEKILQIPVELVSSVKILFTFIFSSMIISVLTSVFGVATFAKNRIDIRSTTELLISVIKLILFLIFFSYFKPSITYVGLIALILSLLTFNMQFITTKKILPGIRISIKNFNTAYVKSILSSSIWNSLNQLGALLLSSSSLFLANIFYGASAAGSYSIVQTVPIFINGLISMLTGVFIPTITYRYAQENKNHLLKEIVKSQKIIGIFSSALISVFISLSYDFFILWTPNENAKLLWILSTLTILPHFFIGSAWSLSNLSVIMNKIKIPAVFMLFSGMINIILVYMFNVFFDYSIIIVPFISTIVQIIWIGVFIPVYASYNLKVNKLYFYPTIIKSLLNGLIVMAFSFYIKSFFYINSWFKLFYLGILLGIIALIYNFLIQIGIKPLKSIIIKKKKNK